MANYETCVSYKNSIIRAILDEISKEMAMNGGPYCDDYEIGIEQGLKTAYGIVESYLTAEEKE